MQIQMVVVMNKFPAVPAKMKAAAGKRIHAAGFRVEGGAKLRSRVDEGTMRNGWNNRPTGPLSTVISNPVAHTIYNERGTRYMSAQPMLGPAMEEEVPRLEASFAGIEGELG